jgi:hypothetical protein
MRRGAPPVLVRRTSGTRIRFRFTHGIVRGHNGGFREHEGVHMSGMSGRMIGAAMAASVVMSGADGFAQTPPAAPAAAAAIVEFSHETRFQMDYHVPEAALAALLPAGFTSSVAAQGPAKDCNLRVIFIDRVTINGPDGRPLGRGQSHLIYLEAPAKDSSGANVRLVIGGLSDDPADAPGPFGNYLLATTHTASHTTTAPTAGTGPTIDSQDWVFAAAGGERIEMHVKYERGGGNRGMRPQDVRIYSAKDPAVVQVSSQEQILDILRNTTTTPPDRVQAYSFKAGGGSLAKLFDGTERALSWDNVIWLDRTVSVPK